MIQIKSLTFHYANMGEEKALSDVSLHISQGDFLGIIGPSGAGKSTLLQCLSGVIPHHYSGTYYGQVLVAGQDTIDSTIKNLSRYIGSVFQDPETQIVTTRVEDEILFGLENFAFPRQEMEERLQESLEVTGITDLRYRDIDDLSGGQKQRVVLAAALALRPQILLLDEPTSELDPQGSYQIFETLKELNEKYGTTIVIVEQKVALLAQYCQRFMVMKGGKILMEGPTRDILKRNKELLEIGVNCPRLVTLTQMFIDHGFYQGDYPVTIEDASVMVKSVCEGGGHA